jgi:NarL family two-component system response regulator LiaR
LTGKPRIIIIEDHPAMRDAIASYFAETGRWELAGTAASLAEAKALLACTAADLVLIDIQLEDGWGLDIIPELEKSPCNIQPPLTAVYSAFDDYFHASTALGMGIRSYVCKRRNLRELEESLLHALEGKTYIDDTVQAKYQTVMDRKNLLTKREMEILNLAKNRLSNKQIATQLGISFRTVENILSCVYDKTGIRSRYELELL